MFFDKGREVNLKCLTPCPFYIFSKYNNIPEILIINKLKFTLN